MSPLEGIPTDDTDDKVRRNFLAVSGAIVLAWWLRLKVPFLAKVFGVPLDSDNIERVWTAALVLLAYFGLRYHFSSGRESAWKACKQDHNNRLFQRIARVLARAVHAQERDSYVQAVKATGHTPEPYLRVSDFLVDVESARFHKVDFTFRRSDDEDGDWERRYRNYPYDADSKQLSILRAVWIYSLTSLETLVFSKGATVLLTPYALGFFALGACVMQIGFTEIAEAILSAVT